jgi:hypothetical protein
MLCFNCDNENDCCFFHEIFPCRHCSEENYMEYNMCPNCGSVWKGINGHVVDESKLDITDLGLGKVLAANPEQLQEVIVYDSEGGFSISQEAADEFLIKLGNIKEGNAAMDDYIIKCLNCTSKAVDVSESNHTRYCNRYTCLDCNFWWEVLPIG